LEKFYAHEIDLHLLFIDFKKAFECINQKKLLEAIKSFGIPKKNRTTCENDTGGSKSQSDSGWKNK
jgi:hypothetical protein